MGDRLKAFALFFDTETEEIRKSEGLWKREGRERETARMDKRKYRIVSRLTSNIIFSTVKNIKSISVSLN